MLRLPTSLRIRLKISSPAEQEVGEGVSAKFLSVSALNPSQSALWKFVEARASHGERGAGMERVMARWSDPMVV